MTATLETVHAVLSEGGYSVGTNSSLDETVSIFENDSVLGFVLYYRNASRLIDCWKEDSDRVLQKSKFALRRAGQKAWNTYLVLLADELGDYGQNISLGAIEEDLTGTRKIARSGVSVSDELRVALLPLLSIQNAPRLEAVDMPAEIKLRTPELPAALVEAFLSDASDATLSQLFENLQ